MKPLCKCGHQMSEHEWIIERMKGQCKFRSECGHGEQPGCTKYRPMTEQPAPLNKTIGRMLYKRKK